MRLSRCEVRDRIITAKTIARPGINPTEPCSGRNRQCASFARFSERRDFRVFRHNRPLAVITAVAENGISLFRNFVHDISGRLPLRHETNALSGPQRHGINVACGKIRGLGSRCTARGGSDEL